MTTSDKIQKRIMEVLYPEGVPLEFGTEVVKKGCLPEYVTGVIAENNGFRYTGEIKAIRTHATRDIWLTGEYEILGKPTTIIDLMRVLPLYGDNRWESITVKDDVLTISAPTGDTETFIEDGVGINGEQYTTGENYTWYTLEFDLSKSLLRDQTPEVQEKIWELIR